MTDAAHQGAPCKRALKGGLRVMLVLGAVLNTAPVAAQAPDQGMQSRGAGRHVQGTLTLDEALIDADWYLPAGEPLALLVLQHGYTRDCANLRGTSLQLMRHGLMVLCLNAQMSGGNPLLADALASLLAGGLAAPGAPTLPRTIIVGGHSAGAVFAARVGWRLATAAPDRLLGALLLDPVASGGFADHLQVVSEAGRRPVLAISANPGACNAQNNALPALRQVRQAALDAGREGFVGVRLTDRSTHVDAEGEDTTAFAVRACGQGAPLPANTDALRRLASVWAVGMASGERDAKGQGAKGQGAKGQDLRGKEANPAWLGANASPID